MIGKRMPKRGTQGGDMAQLMRLGWVWLGLGFTALRVGFTALRGRATSTLWAYRWTSLRRAGAGIFAACAVGSDTECRPAEYSRR